MGDRTGITSLVELFARDGIAHFAVAGALGDVPQAVLLHHTDRSSVVVIGFSADASYFVVREGPRDQGAHGFGADAATLVLRHDRVAQLNHALGVRGTFVATVADHSAGGAFLQYE